MMPLVSEDAGEFVQVNGQQAVYVIMSACQTDCMTRQMKAIGDNPAPQLNAPPIGKRQHIPDHERIYEV